MFKIMVASILLIASSCFANDDLVIQAKINQDFSSKYIAMINLEIKNNTQDWIRLSNPNINFSKKADKNIKVLNGKRLAVWAEYAKEKEQELKASSKFWATFWFGGIGTMYSSATILEKDDDLSRSLKKNKQIYPKGHIYNGDIIVPPGISVKRFFIVSSKNHKNYGYLNQLVFNYEENKNIIKTKLYFRDSQFNENEPKDFLGNQPKNHYIWQSDL